MLARRIARDPRRAVTTAIAVVALATGLTACSDSSGDRHSTAAATEPPSPLDEYLGSSMDDDALLDRAVDQQREIETRTAACMKAVGFDYFPVDPTANISIGRPSATTPQALTVAAAAEYGYGINLVDPESRSTQPPSAPPDPNAAYRDSLSPAEAADYDTALWGTDDADRDITQTQDPAVSGCSFAATAEVMQASPQLSGEFEDLRADIDALLALEVDGPEMATVNAKWQACMEEAGYPDWATPAEPRQDFMDRNAALFTSGGLPATDPRLVALGKEEITVATADATCTEQVGYAAAARAVAVALETEFVASHRDELEAYRDAMGSAG